MSFVGPLYIFSKHDKFMYLLSTLDGEVIEQTFHLSRLKQGLLRLPNGKYVRNINDYKLEMIWLFHKDVVQPETRVPNRSQTFLILVMTLILLISGVNLPQYSRHQLQPVKLIYYIFIMHMPACQLQQTLLQILLSQQLSNYRDQVTPSQYQSVDLILVISRCFAITVVKNH